jgi:hypothetical protein
VNLDLEDLKENIRIYNTVYGECRVAILTAVMKEYRLIVVLEKYSMSNEDIERMLVINNETEDLSKKEKGVKDSIELFFMLEDEDEFVENLRASALFKSILPAEQPKK